VIWDTNFVEHLKSGTITGNIDAFQDIHEDCFNANLAYYTWVSLCQRLWSAEVAMSDEDPVQRTELHVTSVPRSDHKCQCLLLLTYSDNGILFRHVDE
jgi:hypothetical protein